MPRPCRGHHGDEFAIVEQLAAGEAAGVAGDDAALAVGQCPTPGGAPVGGRSAPHPDRVPEHGEAFGRYGDLLLGEPAQAERVTHYALCLHLYPGRAGGGRNGYDFQRGTHPLKPRRNCGQSHRRDGSRPGPPRQQGMQRPPIERCARSPMDSVPETDQTPPAHLEAGPYATCRRDLRHKTFIPIVFRSPIAITSGSARLDSHAGAGPRGGSKTRV